MLRRILLASLPVTALLLAGAASVRHQAQAGDNEIIALEKGALDRWGRGDPEGYLSLYADDITYFDPFQDSHVDGIAKLRAAYAPFAGKIKVDRYELLDTKVQRSGDIAVFVFCIQNYAKQPDGTEKPATKWNVTEVFQRRGGKWRTIHSHFSFNKPNIPAPKPQ